MRVRITSVCASPWTSGAASSRTDAVAARAAVRGRPAASRRGFGRPTPARGSSTGSTARVRPAAAVSLGRRGSRRVQLVEPVLDHLQRQEVLALLAQDPAQPLDVGRRRTCGSPTACARGRCRPWLSRNRIFEIVMSGNSSCRRLEHLADRQVRAGRPCVTRHRRRAGEEHQLELADLHLVAVARAAPRRPAPGSRRCR